MDRPPTERFLPLSNRTPKATKDIIWRRAYGAFVALSCGHHQPALPPRPRQPGIEPALHMTEPLEPDDLCRVVEADQVPHPAEQRNIGDAVIGAHHPVAVRQPLVE